VRDMNNWLFLAGAAVGAVAGAIVFTALVYRRLRQSTEVERALRLAQNIIKDRTVPIDVDIDQELTIPLTGTYKVPSDLRLAVRMDHPIDIEADVPVNASIPLDVIVESTVPMLGSVKIPIRGQIPISITIPVKTRATIKSEALTVSLTKDLELDLPQIVVPLKAKLRVNIPLRLPDAP
jgi:hypothetical protein